MTTISTIEIGAVYGYVEVLGVANDTPFAQDRLFHVRYTCECGQRRILTSHAVVKHHHRGTKQCRKCWDDGKLPPTQMAGPRLEFVRDLAGRDWPRLTGWAQIYGRETGY